MGCGAAGATGETGVAEVWAGVAEAPTTAGVADSCLAAVDTGVVEGVAEDFASVLAEAGLASGSLGVVGSDVGEGGLSLKVGSLKKAELSRLRSTLGTGEVGVEFDETDLGRSFDDCTVVIGREREGAVSG